MPKEQGSGRRPGDRRPEGGLLTHHVQLGERVLVHCVVRLLVGLLIIVGAAVARSVVGVENLEVTALVALGVVIVLYDAVVYASAVRVVPDETDRERLLRLRRLTYAAIVFDYLSLTVAIWLVGGTRSPFIAFYLLHVIVSCFLLSKRAAQVFHWLAYGLLAVLVVGEWTGAIPPKLPLGAVAGTGPLDGRFAITVLAVYGVLFGITSYLMLGLAETFREGERQLHRANQELERLSAMRQDFLRIALHNLQSPIGVVRMFLNNLRTGLGGDITDQQAQWIDRSLKRLDGVGHFMHDLQLLSALESGRLDTRASEVDVRKMLLDLVADQQDLASQAGHELLADVPQALPPVAGVELLLREAAVNYVTNAMKYTPKGGHIVVRGRAIGDRVRIEVEDDGVGIPPDELARLFGEFVRVKRKGTAVDKAQGTGLGLTIVRRVVDVHGGTYGVESVPEKGSTFFIELPAVAGPTLIG